MLISVVIHRFHNWIGLLTALLSWQMSQYFLILWKLGCRRETFRLTWTIRLDWTILVLCCLDCEMSSTIGTKLPFWVTTKGMSSSLYFGKSHWTLWPITGKEVSGVFAMVCLWLFQRVGKSILITLILPWASLGTLTTRDIYPLYSSLDIAGILPLEDIPSEFHKPREEFVSRSKYRISKIVSLSSSYYPRCPHEAQKKNPYL